MIRDFFKLAVHTLIHRKIRSILTVLGIVIGITAVVALISLGNGLKSAINDQFNSVGTNRIVVSPGGSNFGPPSAGSGSAQITEHDLTLIKKIEGVYKTFSFLLDPGQVEFNSRTKFAYIQGISNDPSTYGTAANRLQIIQGRIFKPSDRNKVIVGYNLANSDSKYGRKISIGDKVTIEGRVFDVIGIRGKLGDPVSDDVFLIPIEMSREIFNSGEKFAMINVEVGAKYDVDVVAEKIHETLRKDRHQKEGQEDFSVQTSAKLVESFNSVLSIVQAVLIGIAAISLLVGGVGIMNTMYTSVVEQTKDIGVLKSIGAKDSDVLLLFLIESGTIGLIGGIIGIIIGVSLGKLVEFISLQIFGSALVRAEFSVYLIIGSLLFSFIVGSLAGLLPAKQAAQMNPVEALRYE